MRRPANSDPIPRKRLLVLLFAALVSGSGYAKPISVLGTSVDLPFDYEVVKSIDSISFFPNGFATTQRIDIKPIDGPSKGEEIAVSARYFAADHPDAKAMNADQRRLEGRLRAEPGVRSASATKVDGFDFEFAEATTPDRTHPQSMLLTGVADGLAYQLAIAARNVRPLTPGLAERIKAIHLDLAALRKNRLQFEGEGVRSVANSALETPLGNVSVPANVEMTLLTSLAVRNAVGEPQFRRRTFGLVKPYFGSAQLDKLPQLFVVDMGCGKQGALESDDYDAFVRMSAEQALEDPYRKFTDVRMRDPETLLGLPAQVSTASGQAVDSWRLHHADVRRWAAKKDGDWFMVDVVRYNGAPIEKAMIRQLVSAPAICRLDLPFGSDEAPTNAPPAVH